MAQRRLCNICISLFVVLWTLVFHYESLRYFYLEPLAARTLPKMKFLFPPAGWIMFFNVGDEFAYARVYGIRQGMSQPLDPHDILRTRNIGYDNIHRNVLSVVLDPAVRQPFCGFLKRKFPAYEDFVVTQVYYPRLSRRPQEHLEVIAYQCSQ